MSVDKRIFMWIRNRKGICNVELVMVLILFLNQLCQFSLFQVMIYFHSVLKNFYLGSLKSCKIIMRILTSTMILCMILSNLKNGIRILNALVKRSNKHNYVIITCTYNSSLNKCNINKLLIKGNCFTWTCADRT